jgi:hypothetical protein
MATGVCCCSRYLTPASHRGAAAYGSLLSQGRRKRGFKLSNNRNTSRTEQREYLKMSLPGLTRQSIFFKRIFARWMDARIKSGHDECVRVHTELISKKQHRSPTRVRYLAACFAGGCHRCPAL